MQKHNKKLPAGYLLRSHYTWLLSILLMTGIATFTQGCAASKCDCPRFNGHRLHH